MGWIIALVLMAVVCFNHDVSLLTAAGLFGIAGAISFAFPSNRDDDKKNK
jgi:hypothetical protein